MSDAALIVNTLEQGDCSGSCPCHASARRGSGNTHCPVHADSVGSLTVSQKKDGKVLVNCKAGCSQDAVIAALRNLGLWKQVAQGLTVDELATAKGLPQDFLRALGVRDGVFGVRRERCVDIPYMSPAGEERAVRKRLAVAGNRFAWRRGDHPLPYGLDRLADACREGYLILVEGESDTWTLLFNGIPTLGVPGAAMWRAEWVNDYLSGIERIYVFREPDSGGDVFVDRIAASLPGALVISPPNGIKDANELWTETGPDSAAFRSQIRDLMASAVHISQIAQDRRSKEANEAYCLAQQILEGDVLAHVEHAVRAGGYAGDRRPVLMVYIGVTSRVTRRPSKLAVIAPSAAGKNAALDAALALFPESAFYQIKAGSPRALIYNDESFEHRTVVLSEADSIPEDGPAASAFRSLVEDDYMSYDVVEKDPDTGQQAVRHIVKNGPTGLITTSTKVLGEQLGTRVLVITLNDTPEYTREVIRAQARSANGMIGQRDTTPFEAAQKWIELAGDHDVVIPYAECLAELVPTALVRMRRDFPQLLAFIESIAILYQRQRDRDEQGRIVATLEDYGRARDLLKDVFTAMATGGVSGVIRETVTKLVELHRASGSSSTVTQLGEALCLHPNATWYRVRNAIKLGYIVNEETRRGQPAKLIPGSPLPELEEALPTPEEVEAILCASKEDLSASNVESQAMPVSDSDTDNGRSPIQLSFQSYLETPDSDTSSSAGGYDAGRFQRFNGHEDQNYSRTPHLDADLPRSQEGLKCERCGGVDSWRDNGDMRYCSICHPEPHSSLGRYMLDLGIVPIPNNNVPDE